MKRPSPPAEVIDALEGVFLPAPDLEEWARSTLIDPASPAANSEHEHLQSANLGFLWTNEPNSRAGRVVIGQCELMPPMAMGKWARARALYQIEQWFGYVPHFLITISAPAAEMLDDASFMALIDHELTHAGQAKDDYGQPRFSKSTGLPVFALRGHDVEEFVSIVRRYGAAAANVEAMVEAARGTPELSPARISASCGNCVRLVR